MHGTDGSCSFWPPGIACAGVVVIFLSGVVGRSRHAPSLTSSPGLVEAEALPSHRVVLSRWSPVLWPPPTSHAASRRISLALIPAISVDVATDHMRSPLFHRLLSQHSAPPTPESPSRLHIQSLHLFRGLHHWLSGSALPGSLSGYITTLQDSLDGTDCCFELLSQEHTPLRHPQSPGSTGSLLCGSLAITATGLPPVSKR